MMQTNEDWTGQDTEPGAKRLVFPHQRHRQLSGYDSPRTLLILRKMHGKRASPIVMSVTQGMIRCHHGLKTTSN